MNEIVGKLRGAGYRVYTSPSTPVQGKITRILVGPDASKDKLKGSLGELKQLSGLSVVSGVVMGYTPNYHTVLPDATLARLIRPTQGRTVGRIRRLRRIRHALPMPQRHKSRWR